MIFGGGGVEGVVPFPAERGGGETKISQVEKGKCRLTNTTMGAHAPRFRKKGGEAGKLGEREYVTGTTRAFRPRLRETERKKGVGIFGEDPSGNG